MPLGFGSLCVLAKKQSANGCHNFKTRVSALGVALWGLGDCVPRGRVESCGVLLTICEYRARNPSSKWGFRVDPRGCEKTLNPAASDHVAWRPRLSSI